MKKILMILCMISLAMTPIKADEPIPVSDMNDITEPGTYLVKVSYTDDKGNKYFADVVMTLTQEDVDKIVQDKKEALKEEPGSTIEEDIVVTGETIEADNFTVSKGVIELLSDREIISRANARAYDTNTGEVIAFKITEKTRQPNTSYRIRFETDKGSTKTITAYETTSNANNDLTWDTPNVHNKEFGEVSPFTLTVQFFAWLLIPIILIGCIYIYANKRIKDAEDVVNKFED